MSTALVMRPQIFRNELFDAYFSTLGIVVPVKHLAVESMDLGSNSSMSDAFILYLSSSIYNLALYKGLVLISQF